MSALRPGWPYGRVYSPEEVGARISPPEPRHAACGTCGGYLQGTREILGSCLNCAEGRGWATQPVVGEVAR